MKWAQNGKEKQKPILSWCENVEEGAMKQAIDLSNHPSVFHHVALMPDCHQGYGMPIGGVIACEKDVIPNAVGVDIGCLDKETEYLSEKGWVKLSEYMGGKIAQFDKETEIIQFVKPFRYIDQESKGFFYLKSKYGLDQMLSELHKILFWQGVKNRGWKKIEYTAKDFVAKHNSLQKGLQGGFSTVFKVGESKGLNISDEIIRVWVMVSADGRIKSCKTKEDRIELHFVKERKYDRAEILLKEAKIKYNSSRGKDGSYWIYFDNGIAKKSLSAFWRASAHQLSILAKESFLWDGYKGDHEFYSTTIKEHADLIQYALASIGIRAGIQKTKSEKHSEWNPWYSVYKTKNTIVGVPPVKIEKIPSPGGREYCFTVPSGFFLARRNNKIFITGNCGMCAVRTNFPTEDITPELIKQIFGIVRNEIPVGFKHRSQPLIWNGFEKAPDIKIIQEQLKSARNQLGTLGGGNHFIEIQAGHDGLIWLMLHSGSRNIGFKIAKYYHKLAQELCEKYHANIPVKDLAFLPVESEEGQEYITAMQFALGFAARNRTTMMGIFSGTVDHILDCQFTKVINIHHNYADIENHFGRNVWVHRKGATLARKGIEGIIPGSMGTTSYIVEGLGNPDSFHSCSHGAGRTMSRSNASKTLTVKECDKAMEGIIYGRWGKGRKGNVDLGEAPQAYKNIHEVIAAQDDLVRVVYALEPLGVIKG